MGVGGDNGEGAGVEVSNTMSENGQFFFLILSLFKQLDPLTALKRTLVILFLLTIRSRFSSSMAFSKGNVCSRYNCNLLL